jgi:hypothetical protein
VTSCKIGSQGGWNTITESRYHLNCTSRGCNGKLFVLLDLSWSHVTSKGVLLEEYIGKYIQLVTPIFR